MRIISGFLRGKKINYLKNLNTRPLKDSVKENIFNILRHSKFINIKIENSNILDLYSGVGSFGIECISRGAGKVIFVERDFLASKVLKDNLKKLFISDKTILINQNLQKSLFQDLNQKFEIFFLDPPFKDSDFLKNLNYIKESKIFNQNHVVIIHRESKATDNFQNMINVLKIKSYGRSKIIFATFN
tara:strand:+ start:316 stop:876 length:561 start_codon:yes stop_codon:yes gene_type:complete